MVSIPAVEHAYDVVLLNPEHISTGRVSLRAAYFVEDGSYTLFKDRGHAVVAALRTDLVVFVTRERAVEFAD